MSKSEMQQALGVSDATACRRNLLDGGYVIGLLTLAIVIGYGILQPPASRARGVARAVPVASATLAASPSEPVLPLAPPVQAEVERTPSRPAPLAPEDFVARPPRRELARLTPPLEREAPKPPETRVTPETRVPAEPRVTPETRVPAEPRVPWPVASVSGRVLDDAGNPVAGASIVVGGREIRTAEDGTFTADELTDGPLLVKMPGFEKVSVQPTKGPIEVALKPFVVKAAYLTYFGFNSRTIRTRVLGLIERTELNAVVIDVKGDRGWVLYRTRVPLALEIGAQGPATSRDFDALMAEFKARGVYTIARIVPFKDNVLANHRPEWAILDRRTGKPWIDRENLAWADPFREEVWDYNIALAKEAVAHGFDEVQFDYVRFPTDGRLGAAKYAKPNTKLTRLPTIAAFLERARNALGPTGAFVAADVFGYTAFNANDTDIGQRIEELTPHLDYICPMVYPSGYHVGIPGYRNPVANAYMVVHESVRLIRARAAHTIVRVRPWLQDFRDYAFDHRIFGVAEIRDQMRGADEAGATGWMLWNPRNDYTGAALRPKGTLAAQ